MIIIGEHYRMINSNKVFSIEINSHSDKKTYYISAMDSAHSGVILYSDLTFEQAQELFNRLISFLSNYKDSNIFNIYKEE